MTLKKKLAVLIDLSGTIHIEDCAIKGAIEAIGRLRANPRVRMRFVTNTTKESIGRLHSRLQKIGFDIAKHEIFTSMSAARRLVENERLRPMLLLEDVALEDFEGIDTTNPNAVVIGLAPSQFYAERMNEAFRLVLDGAKLIAIHKARYFKSADGMALGPGPFVQALEFATDTKATVVGKPESAFFHMALQSLMDEESAEEISAEDAVMIGDDARDDVQGALDAGMKAILVKTGKYRDGDERKITGDPPALDSIVDAVDYIERLIDNS
uniref:Haloacid dehalogenase-like hydrolase domain-containing protein 2 n=1 Tax=Plectus sambesii TaxID=2011161 RepID=A0A914WAQ6_9BILA